MKTFIMAIKIGDRSHRYVTLSAADMSDFPKNVASATDNIKISPFTLLNKINV